MPTVRTLIPVTMYVVSYELAHGRPYSKLEELLLRAIGGGSAEQGHTFESLRATFLVHDRLLTESLVTLIQEGWVAMNQSDQAIRYLVTLDGQLTIKSERKPTNLRVRTSRTRIVRERLTGQLARAADLSLVTATMLRSSGRNRAWQMSLAPRLTRTMVSGGEAEWLLPRSDQRQEWIRWIDNPVRVSQDLHYLPVQVDLANRNVIGLPRPWLHMSQLIIDEVVERRHDIDNEDFQRDLRGLMQKSPSPRSRRSAEPGGRSTAGLALESPSLGVAAVTCDDLALNADENNAVTESALAGAIGNVLIVTSGLTLGRATGLLPILAGLAERDVVVDLLWSGAEGTDDRAVLNILGSSRGIASGRITFNRGSCPFSGDLVLAMTPVGPTAVVGAAFAGQSVGARRLEPAVRIHEVLVVCLLARLGAGWWESCAGEENRVPGHRWKRLAERWAEETVASEAAHAGAGHTCRADGSGRCDGNVYLLGGPQRDGARAELLRKSAEQLQAGSREVLATDDAWLVTTDSGGEALSFCVTGHVAEQARARLAVLEHGQAPP